jgi:hypothetical protein
MTYDFLVAKVVWNLGLFARSFPRTSGPKALISVHGGFFVGNSEAHSGDFFEGVEPLPHQSGQVNDNCPP